MPKTIELSKYEALTVLAAGLARETRELVDDVWRKHHHPSLVGQIGATMRWVQLVENFVETNAARCEWRWGPFYDAFDTSCGEEYLLLTGTPSENNMIYCPFCGKKIKEKAYEPDEEPTIE